MSVRPELREAVDRVLTDFRSSLHTSFPARVIAYDVDKQTLDVRPALKRESGTDAASEPFVFAELPDLYSVPIMWPRGGGFAVTFPLKVGDWVLVHCAEQSTAPWRVRGQAPSPPGLNDPHGLNGCVAVPGWFPDAQKLAGVSSTDLVIGHLDGSSAIRLKPNGDIVIGDALAQPVALAEKLDLIFRTATALPMPTDPVSLLVWATGFVAAITAAYPGGLAAELGPVPPPAPGVPSTASAGAQRVRAT